jgi:hypothetical protein|tara:strand:+ start:105 stop:437 length:333 start_codon:yes stop_codon:yes gene_type:complete
MGAMHLMLAVGLMARILGYVFVYSKFIFKQGCCKDAKLHKILIALEVFEKSINHPETKWMVFPNLDLLPPEDEVGLRASVRVAEKSIFGEVAKSCVDELPNVFIVCHFIA